MKKKKSEMVRLKVKLTPASESRMIKQAAARGMSPRKYLRFLVERDLEQSNGIKPVDENLSELPHKVNTTPGIMDQPNGET